MYSWKIELTLNSGKELMVYYEGYESNSLNVAKRLLEARDGDIMAFGNKEKYTELTEAAFPAFLI